MGLKIEWVRPVYVVRASRDAFLRTLALFRSELVA
jgi:hypothetical protein